MINSLITILVAANEAESLKQFFHTVEQRLPDGCSILIIPAIPEQTTPNDKFLSAIFNATTLPVTIAMHHTPLKPATVFVAMPADNLLIEQQQFVIGSEQIQQDYFTHFWQSVAACPIEGKAGIVVNAPPAYYQSINAINASGGITLYCMPTTDTQTHPQQLKAFNYLQTAADTALTVAHFLQLFEPQKQDTPALSLPVIALPPPDAADTTANPSLPNTQDDLSNLQTIANLLTQALNTAQTAILLYTEQGNLIYHNQSANLYANVNNQPTLASTTFFVLLPNIETDVQNVLQSGNPTEYTLTDTAGKPIWVKILPLYLPYQKAIALVFVPLMQAEELERRFQLLKDELETQGLQQIKTILQLKREVAANERQRQLLESILSNMGEGVMATNETGQLILLNQRASEITGITQLHTDIHQWVKQYQFLIPDDAQNAATYAENPFIRGLMGKTVIAEEWQVVEPQSGAIKYWQIHSRPYQTGHNAAHYGAVMVISDTTTRKQAELELLNSQQTQKALLDAVPDLLFRVNKDGIYLDYIPAKTDSHIPPAAFIGNHLADFMPAEIADDMLEQLHTALQSMQVQTYPFELINNTIKFYETRFSPINPAEALGIVRDVTDIIVGKDAVRRGARHYQRLLAASNFAVVVCNRKGEIIYANPAAAQLLQYDNAQELQGKFIEEFVLRKQRPAIKEAIKDGFVEALAFAPLRLTLVSRLEQEITAEITGSVITYENQLAAQLTLQNVSLQAEWEKQFWLLAQANNCPMAWVNPEKQTINYANAAFLNLLGQTDRTVLKKKWLSFAPAFQPDGATSASKWAALKQQIIQTGINSPVLWTFENTEAQQIQTQMTILTPPPSASSNHPATGKWIVLISPLPPVS